MNPIQISSQSDQNVSPSLFSARDLIKKIELDLDNLSEEIAALEPRPQMIDHLPANALENMIEQLRIIEKKLNNCNTQLEHGCREFKGELYEALDSTQEWLGTLITTCGKYLETYRSHIPNVSSDAARLNNNICDED